MFDALRQVSRSETGSLASYTSTHFASPDAIYELGQEAFDRDHYHDSTKLFLHLLEANTTVVPHRLQVAGTYGLIRSYIALRKLGAARQWTDKFYRQFFPLQAHPAYHLCRALREDGQNEAAFYYYLLAKKASPSSLPGDLPAEPDIHDYLLDYEKSILWSYVGDIGEPHSRLHGLSFSVQMLEKFELPHHIRDSVFNNLQYYVSHLTGRVETLRAEKPIDEEWRFSSPTFVADQTLVRVVNYYVSDDGSYHVSKGERVMTRLVSARTEEEFSVQVSETLDRSGALDGLVHRNAYILGLEDTRAVMDTVRNNTIFTLSASQEYSRSDGAMSQVLGVLSLADHTLTIQAVLEGPYPDRTDKNWVFAGGLDNVVYGWHPSIEIGAIDPKRDARLHVHTSIPSPASFHGMRGSSNGVRYRDAWWFVTHAVIYRPGQMRKYLHRIVLLDNDLSAIVRYSLPFTFEEGSDVEYCLGLKVTDAGMVFGYSVRDRSTKLMHVEWKDVEHLFIF